MTRSNEISKKSQKKLRNQLWAFLKSEEYEPQSQKDLFINCNIAKRYHSLAKKMITEFLTKEMILIKNNLIHPQIQKEQEPILGKIQIHPKGFGFVIADDLKRFPKDIFIPKPHTLHAVDQDRVEVKIVSEGKNDKGPEGAVISIVQRGRDSLIGIIYETTKNESIAYCPILGENKIVHVLPSKKVPLKLGDRVLLEIVNWESYPEKFETKPVSLIGHITDATKDVDVALIEYKLTREFPKETVAEAKKFSKNPNKQDLKNRLDLTEIESFTIDPDTAKDYDDALSLTKDENGDFHLIVHIADVSYYVPPESALDKEAFRRSNSTYFPKECVPMLPEELSNGLCSLKEDVVRLTVSVFISLNAHGELKNYDIKRTYIKSQKRFTYKEAKRVLDELEPSVHYPTLKLMQELALLLQKKRHQRGSVDLSLPEIVLKIDEKGEPTGFEVIEYDITHQLVEEFMLKANEIVAHALLARSSPAIFRIHESPGLSEINDFGTLARAYGFKIKKDPTQHDIQHLFREAKGSPFLHALSIAFIRSMKLAIYSEQNVGHFGLSLEHYCHFTSPIRRYSDLVIHRLLFEITLDGESLKKIASHCSEKERISFRAEQSVINLKKLRFLHACYEKEPEQVYEAMISKVKPFGIFFELSSVQHEGFIHISEIGDEYYIYDDRQNQLIGEKTHHVFKSGSKVLVKILLINLIKQEILWKILHEEVKKTKKTKR